MPTHSTLSHVEASTKAVDVFLTVLDGNPGKGAATAYKAALTRHGRNLAAVAGPEALAAVLAHILAAAPDKAAGEARERVVLDAWAKLIPQERAA